MKVSIDTRTLEPGDIFIPIKGKNFDGHHFIQEAIQKGASKILDVDLGQYAANYRKKLNCFVIAITGSAGKTTLKEMLGAILSTQYTVTKTHLNYNNEIGVPLTLLKADANTDIIIVEMGMRKPGDLSYLSRIVRPTHTVITNIGLSHIEFFNSQKALAKEKSMIFQRQAYWEHSSRFGFLPQRSRFYEQLKKRAIQCGYTVFPFYGDDLLSETINLCQILGKQFNLNETAIHAGLSHYQAIERRLQLHRLKNKVTLIDDTYNANPDGFYYALHYLKQFSGTKKLVIGNMEELGHHTQKAHESLIQPILDTEIQSLYLIGEKAQNIHLSIPTYKAKTQIDLFKKLTQDIQANDILLIKGSRSMQLDQLVDRLIAHYS